MFKSAVGTIILIWAAWAAMMLGFQALADARMQPALPDYAVEWSHTMTEADSQLMSPYLSEPFMNRQVAFDSEYYLSIATADYDDPDGRSVRGRSGTPYPLNYAFFPLYPQTMSILSAPLRVLNLNPIATATLAGVIISLVGTLAAMFALHFLTRTDLGTLGGIRTAFYLLIFPSSLFFAQVYTEGLFVGLAFSALALMYHPVQRWWMLPLAGILAALATWTRAVGLLLIIPLVIAWINLVRLDYRRYALSIIAVLLPLGAYLVWNAQFGRTFQLVEELWFGRELFNTEVMQKGWERAFEFISTGQPLESRIYFSLEIAAIVLAAVACLATLRRYPGIALFGLAALIASVTSGSPQSLIRYVLVIPSLYIFLSHLGQYTAFDRAWTLGSTLLLALLTMLYTYNMWVA